MAVNAEDLFLEPFREVIQRTTEASANAEAAQHADPDLAKAMSKAAAALLREGDRALRRLQPLWNSQVEKHGESFEDAMRDDGEFF